MGIWQHSQSSGPVIEPPFNPQRRTHDCPYCGSPVSIRQVEYNQSTTDSGHDETKFNFCRTCGWWFLRREEVGSVITGTFGDRTYDGDWGDRSLGRSAALRDFDLTDLSAPIGELRTYLLARYDQRFRLHPRLLEILVLEIFKDFGYTGYATAYQNDGGIDVILSGPDDAIIGVQVKRYRDSITVDQIRSLAGALVLHGLTRGVFVTTSEYQRGCASTAERFEARGLPVELMDAARLLDALRITQRAIDYEADEIAEIAARCPLQLLAHTIGSCNNTAALPLR